MSAAADMPIANTDDQRRLEILKAMDIDVWVQRTPTVAVPASDTSKPEVFAEPSAESLPVEVAAAPSSLESSAPISADPILPWDELKHTVAACTACELHRDRTQTVFGVGDNNATCLIIGEAPGAEEDRRGEPFVGRAGELLNAMLAAIGLKREQVFIANILKCRPPQNRDPEPAEVAACSHFLAQQVEMIKPRFIVALGRVAAQNLLNTDTPIGRMRGQIYHYGEPTIPVVVTSHPA